MEGFQCPTPLLKLEVKLHHCYYQSRLFCNVFTKLILHQYNIQMQDRAALLAIQSLQYEYREYGHVVFTE